MGRNYYKITQGVLLVTSYVGTELRIKGLFQHYVLAKKKRKDRCIFVFQVSFRNYEAFLTRSLHSRIARLSSMHPILRISSLHNPSEIITEVTDVFQHRPSTRYSSSTTKTCLPSENETVAQQDSFQPMVYVYDSNLINFFTLALLNTNITHRKLHATMPDPQCPFTIQHHHPVEGIEMV